MRAALGRNHMHATKGPHPGLLGSPVVQQVGTPQLSIDLGEGLFELVGILHHEIFPTRRGRKIVQHRRRLAVFFFGLWVATV